MHYEEHRKHMRDKQLQKYWNSYKETSEMHRKKHEERLRKIANIENAIKLLVSHKFSKNLIFKILKKYADKLEVSCTIRMIEHFQGNLSIDEVEEKQYCNSECYSSLTFFKDIRFLKEHDFTKQELYNFSCYVVTSNESETNILLKKYINALKE